MGVGYSFRRLLGVRLAGEKRNSGLSFCCFLGFMFRFGLIFVVWLGS